MIGRPLAPLDLGAEEESALVGLASRRTTAQALALRARIVLASAAGEFNQAVAAKLGVIWIEQTEGAKFWLRVMNELKNRGVSDILIAVVDGLKGFPEAITAVFPQTVVQTCIVHLIRHSLEFVVVEGPQGRSCRRCGRSTGPRMPRPARRLEAFDAGPWGREYPAIAQSWRRNWERGHAVLRLPRRRPPHHLHHG